MDDNLDIDYEYLKHFPEPPYSASSVDKGTVIVWKIHDQLPKRLHLCFPLVCNFDYESFL